MKIGIIGCSGRMGKALIEETLLLNNFELSGGTVKEGSELTGIDLGTIVGIDNTGINAGNSLDELFESCDAVIDFSNPQTSITASQIAAKTKKIHIIGTTGFSDNDIKELTKLAKQTKILWSSNMSVGINVLSALTEQVAKILDESFDIEIVEMHHYQKVDAPSGTALLLGESAAKGRAVNLNDVACKSREGIIGKRPVGEIGFSTIRGGDVIGDHTVMFAGDGERIELTHKSSSRKIYAKGALRAALWLKNQSAGKLYSMQEVLAG